MDNTKPHRLEVIGIPGIGEIDRSSDLTEAILLAASNQGLSFKNMDILVVTQKIVSKAEG